MDDKEVTLIRCIKEEIIESEPHDPLAPFSHSPLTFNPSTQNGSTGDQNDPPETTIIEIKREPVPYFEDETPDVHNNFHASFSVQHKETSVESADAVPGLDLDIKVPSLEKTNHEEVAPFSCSHCTYRCHNLRHLNKHMKIQHSVQRRCKKTFPCPFCSFVTHKGDYIPIHIKTHTGEKPYSCNLCDYKCIQKSSLTMHMQRHSPKKPYFCHDCNYTAKVCNDLNKHIKEKHCDNYILSCNICPYKCNSSGLLKEHHKRGTGDDKPYACTVCSHRYQSKQSLNLHLKLHPELNYSCPLCSFTTVFENKYNKHFEGHAK